MEKKAYMRLNAFLAKEDIVYEDLDHFINEPSCTVYDLKDDCSITGRLFVKAPEEKSPIWKDFLELGINDSLDYLINKSSSAALLVKHLIEYWLIRLVMDGFCLIKIYLYLILV